MAGALSLYFEHVTKVYVSGFYLQHRMDNRLHGHAFAGVYFTRMRSVLPDAENHEWWDVDQSTFHISLATFAEEPMYSQEMGCKLQRCMRRWSRQHRVAELSLQYINLEDAIDEEERIVLQVILDGKSILVDHLCDLRQ